MTVDEFEREVELFCSATLRRRTRRDAVAAWGVGSDAMVVIEEPDPVEERRKLADAQAWRKRLDEADLAWIDGPVGLGGRGLGPEHVDAFRSVLAGYDAPDESPIAVGLEIVGPAIAIHGTDVAKRVVLRGMHIGDEVGCQLFSEPNAGSDLSAVRTRAERVAGGWHVTGQKVWTSGGHLATYGEALVRTEPGSERHRGLTMVLVDMRAPGVEVRPLRQMTGGCSFNEVFLQDVFVPDEMVLEGEGTGWQVALTTLMQERLSVGAGRTSPAHTALHRLRQLVDHLGVNSDPVVRQRLADLIVRSKVSTWFQQRAVLAKGGPGPEMSIAKLHFTSLLTDIAELACDVLGPAVIADTGEWGTFAWSEFVIGAPGMHIAGGTGQIQRNILAERVLGLPR